MSTEVTNKDIFKHYLSSALIYGILLGIISFSPVYYKSISDPVLNHVVFFLIYYIGYLIIAPIIYFIKRPESILTSNALTTIRYFKRQIAKHETTKDYLENITPTEDEKQAMMTFFIKAFFGAGTVILIFNSILPSLDYNIEFLKTFFATTLQYISEGKGFFQGVAQYIFDTSDVWVQMSIAATTIVLAFSYLTDAKIFGSKIKSTDTSVLGVLSCIACYFPVTILTTQIVTLSLNSQIPVPNKYLLLFLNISIVLVNFFQFIATARLFGKSGNLTNRGIVTGFPYNITRHPQYTMQVLYILLASIPVWFIPQASVLDKTIYVIGLFVWVYIYYLRAVTEERHLIKDEDYQKYVEKVKYRFIPKIW